MNFLRQDLAGAIRTESFLKPDPDIICWRNREGEPLRLVALIVILVCLFLFMSGCTYNRNAPLIDFEANGNTVTPGAIAP